MLSLLFAKEIIYTMGEVTTKLNKKFKFNKNKSGTEASNAINYLNKLTKNTDFNPSTDLKINYELPNGTPPERYIPTSTYYTIAVPYNKDTSLELTIGGRSTTYENLKYEIIGISIYPKSVINNFYLQVTGSYNNETRQLPIKAKITSRSTYGDIAVSVVVESVRGTYKYSATLKIVEST